jgi:hypothetical protein
MIEHGAWIRVLDDGRVLSTGRLLRIERLPTVEFRWDILVDTDLDGEVEYRVQSIDPQPSPSVTWDAVVV